MITSDNPSHVPENNFKTVDVINELCSSYADTFASPSSKYIPMFHNLQKSYINAYILDALSSTAVCLTQNERKHKKLKYLKMCKRTNLQISLGNACFVCCMFASNTRLIFIYGAKT